jgi:ribosomal protein L34E
MPQIFKRGRPANWTLDRVARLTPQEIKRLRENAERLNEPTVAALCDEALKGKRSRAPRSAAASASGDG